MPGLDAPTNIPEIPDSLEHDPAALAEWQRITPWLSVTRRIADLDRMAVAAYCIEFSLWQRAAQPLLQFDGGLYGITDKGEFKPVKAAEVFHRHAIAVIQYRASVWDDTADPSLGPR